MTETTTETDVPRVSAVFVTNYGHRGQLWRAGQIATGMPKDLAEELLGRKVVRKPTKAEAERLAAAAKSADEDETDMDADSEEEDDNKEA